MTKILTLKEIMKKRGYTEKQIKQFYQRKEKLAKMNIRYTLEAWERGE